MLPCISQGAGRGWSCSLAIFQDAIARETDISAQAGLWKNLYHSAEGCQEPFVCVSWTWWEDGFSAHFWTQGLTSGVKVMNSMALLLAQSDSSEQSSSQLHCLRGQQAGCTDREGRGVRVQLTQCSKMLPKMKPNDNGELVFLELSDYRHSHSALCVS